MGELIVGGLLVVLGFVGGRVEAWMERRRARRTLATALLTELRWLEGMLNQVMEHGPAMSYDALEHLPCFMRWITFRFSSRILLSG
jgi:hypothetical protein